jgi:cytochrome c-type biogenesis protein CcsB
VDLRFLGSVVTGLVLVLLGIATVGFRVAVSPLPPALQNYWLVIHVLVAILATGFFTISGALSAVQLLQSRREARVAAGGRSRLRLLATVPDAGGLENLAYRVAIVGFILWTFTLIAGAIWANHAWGRYWGWDTKEVWTFIIWVIYAGYIHARATRGWRGTRSSWLALIGYAAVLFNFGIVNVFFKGLHAYSGLPH